MHVIKRCAKDLNRVRPSVWSRKIIWSDAFPSLHILFQELMQRTNQINTKNGTTPHKDPEAASTITKKLAALILSFVSRELLYGQMHNVQESIRSVQNLDSLYGKRRWCIELPSHSGSLHVMVIAKITGKIWRADKSGERMPSTGTPHPAPQIRAKASQSPPKNLGIFLPEDLATPILHSFLLLEPHKCDSRWPLLS